MIFGADLGKDDPIGVPEQIDKVHSGGSTGLPNRLGFPMLPELDEKEVIAELRFDYVSRIAIEIFVNQPHVPVIGMPGAIGVVAKGEKVGEPSHGVIGMVVIHGVDKLSTAGPNSRRNGRFGSPLAGFRRVRFTRERIFCTPGIAVVVSVV